MAPEGFERLSTAAGGLVDAYERLPGGYETVDPERLRELCLDSVPSGGSDRARSVRRRRLASTREAVENVLGALPDDLDPAGLSAALQPDDGGPSVGRTLHANGLACCLFAVVELRARYDLSVDAVDRVADAAEGITDGRRQPTGPVAEAAAALRGHLLAAAKADRLFAAVRRAHFPPFARQAQRTRSHLRDCVQRGDVEAVDDHREAFDDAGPWEQSDLLDPTPEEFESLLAALYRCRGDEAKRTRYVADRGVDVVVRRRDSTVLIQAKQFGIGKTVGIDDAQRTAGLLLEFDADRVVVATSASFTEPAAGTAAAVDSLTLRNGEWLVRALNASPLRPPFGPE